MPEPAHSKTRATAAIAASVLSVTGVGAAHADVQVQNTGGMASPTAVESDNPPSAANATPIENVATQNSPQVYVEQGVVINPARSQSITVTGEGFTGGPVERYGVAVYVSEYRQYPLYALGRGSAVTMTLVPELDVDGGRFSTQLTLPAGTLDPNQQYVVATAVVDPGKGYATEDPSYNSSAPLEVLPADTQDEPLNVQILSGQLEIPQEKNLVVYKVTGLGEAQAFEVMTYAFALDSQGNRILLAASPAHADVVNGTLLDGIEVPGSRLEEVQAVHEDLRYVLSVEVAPSAANGYTAQEVEVPFMNGWNVQHGSAPVATAERAMAEQELADKKQVSEEVPVEQATQPTQGVQSEQVASSNTVEQFDHVLPEDDPRRHYDLPRNTLFDRVHDTTKEDTTEEQTNDTASPVMTARLHVEETVVPENDSEKTLTVRGEGFAGVGSVHLMVSAVDEYGVATGGMIASADVSEIDASGAFSAQVQIPGSALKPGTTYRVSAVAEDEQGTVRMVNGGFTVERDSVDNAPATPEQDAPAVEAPAADASVPAEPAESAPAESTPVADQASAAEQKAGESSAEQKNEAPVATQNASQNAPVQNTSAQKSDAQKVEAQASGGQKVAAATQSKREQLAATGASNMLVISAAGSLSLLAGMRLSRRRRSEMRLSSRR